MSAHTRPLWHGEPGAARRRRRAWLLALAFAALGGCENLEREEVLSKGPAFDQNAKTDETFYEPLRPPGEEPAEAQEGAPGAELPTTFAATPRVRVDERVASVPGDDLAAGLRGEPISVNYNNIPLPNFINQVFGEQLGLSFTIAPDIRKQQDLVTLRITKAVTPAERKNELTLDGFYEMQLGSYRPIFEYNITFNNSENTLRISSSALYSLGYTFVGMFIGSAIVDEPSDSGGKRKSTADPMWLIVYLPLLLTNAEHHIFILNPSNVNTNNSFGLSIFAGFRMDIFISEWLYTLLVLAYR